MTTHRARGTPRALLRFDQLGWIDKMRHALRVIIRTIKRAKGLHTVILPIPYGLFRWLLRLYARFSGKPPFTAAQLDALAAGDEFHGVDTREVFGVAQTPFVDAVRESYCDPRYSHIVLKR